MQLELHADSIDNRHCESKKIGGGNVKRMLELRREKLKKENGLNLLIRRKSYRQNMRLNSIFNNLKFFER
jgi:hypothetical protein